MTEIIFNLIVGFLVLGGALLSLAATFGVIRLPDVYTRNHAISKSTTLGVMMVLLGALLYFFIFEDHFNSRLLLAVIFIFMTAPVSGHLIGRASYNSGVKLWDESVIDDLARDKKKERKQKETL